MANALGLAIKLALNIIKSIREKNIFIKEIELLVVETFRSAIEKNIS